MGNRREREWSSIRVDSNAAAASTTIFAWASRWRVRGAINIMDARGFPLIIHHQMAHHRVALQGKPSRACCRGQRHGGRVEVRSGVASTLAFIAIVAGGTTLVRHGQIRHAVRHHTPAKSRLDNMLRQQIAAGKIHWRKELSIGHLLQALTRSAHANEAFYFVVIGFNLFVVKWPILPVAVAPGRLELIVAVAIAFARPTERLPSHLPSPNPHEGLVWREGIGMLMVIDEELVAVFVAGVTKTLHGLIW